MKKLEMLALDSYLVNFGFISQIPAIRYQCHCTHMFPTKCKMVVESFGRIITTVFEKKWKRSPLAVSWSISAVS